MGGPRDAEMSKALYDPLHGFNPPARYQQERAWCEVVSKEKHIQAAHERQNRARELGGPKRWPGGPACGFDEAAAARPPFFVDSDIWRGELHKRQPLKAQPSHGQAAGPDSLTRMDTMAIVDLKRRTEAELEKRSWSNHCCARVLAVCVHASSSEYAYAHACFRSRMHVAVYFLCDVAERRAWASNTRPPHVCVCEHLCAPQTGQRLSQT